MKGKCFLCGKDAKVCHQCEVKLIHEREDKARNEGQVIAYEKMLNYVLDSINLNEETGISVNEETGISVPEELLIYKDWVEGRLKELSGGSRTK